MDSLDAYFQTAFELGNSQAVIIFGPRNIDYTQLIREKSMKFSALIVYLSGILSNDDTSTFKNIGFQLSLEKNLSFDVRDNFQEILESIKQLLLPDDRVLIFIKEIDQFAHKIVKQNLLYTLFELIYEERAKICLVGTTLKLNFVELLEKRIRSRFTCQHILAFNYSDSSSKDEMMGRSSNMSARISKNENIKELREYELVVLLCYVKVEMKGKKVSPSSAFYNYDEFIRYDKPILMYCHTKVNFIMITKELIRLGLLFVSKKSKIFNHTHIGFNFDIREILESIKIEELIVSSAIKDWILS